MTWCSSAVNRAPLSLAATSRTRSSPWGTSGPALRPGRVGLSVFPLANPLSSTTSATGPPALFGGFAGTTGLSDFPRSSISGLWPWPCLSGPPGDQPVGRPRDLPVLAHGGSVHAVVLRPRGALRRLANSVATGVAFSVQNHLGAPNAKFRGSIARPARAPVNASPAPSRTPTHDSGSPWVATPSV